MSLRRRCATLLLPLSLPLSLSLSLFAGAPVRADPRYTIDFLPAGFASSAIDDADQILGRACRLGTCADVRLGLVPAVPEPAGLALPCAGLGLLAWRARRRRTPPRARSRATLSLATRSGATRSLATQSVVTRSGVSRSFMTRALGVALALAAPAVLAEPLYSATFLPLSFTAYGIGSDGSVVGGGTNADGQSRAFVWRDGTTTFLPTLGGPSAYATGTAGGAVIGASLSGDFTRGFIYRDGGIQSVGTLYGGDSIAYGINASGQVVGDSTDTSGNNRAFLYSGGTLTDIGTLGGTDAGARGINSAGMIVGGSQPGTAFPDDGAHAFLYRDGAMHDLGTLGGGSSWAYAVNDAGQVVGNSLVAGNAAWHPFLYSDGKMTDLGSFGGVYSEAHAINAAGVVVGYSSFAEFGLSHAFVYADAGLTDLNTVTDGVGIFVLTDAVGINDAGQIVANGCTTFGGCAPVVLTPLPEPAAALLLLAGIPVLAWRRRGLRRQN